MNNSRRLLVCCIAAAAAALLATATIAHAGAVYRCTGPNGQIAITNKPKEYSSCSKLPNTDYADQPASRPSPNPVATAKPAVNTEAFAKPASSSMNSVAAKPDPEQMSAPKPARSEYKSAPASQFANVIGGVRINGVEQKQPALENVTEKVDKSTEVRRGAVYKVARADGITEYTNVRPSGGPYQLLFTYIATCYACNVHSAIDFATVALNLTAYRDEVAAAATEFGIDAALLRAVIHAESAFNPNALSDKGAQGLMQLMPATASDLGISSPFDIGQNIRGGAHYLAILLKQFNGDERLAAAAYNAGPQNVQKYSGVPPFDETKVYVERVATLRKRYGDAK